MLKNAALLAGVELRGLLGFNEARYGRDKKKKRRAVFMAVVYAALILMMMLYIALMAVGLALINMPDAIVIMLCAVISLVTLVFTFFSAGGSLFSLAAYEREIALPVSPADIVAGRFLAMYAPNAVLSFLAMLPGFAVYAYYSAPSFSSYLAAFLGTLVMPLIPMSVACALAFAVYAVASVMKRKNLVNVLLALVATLFFMVFPYLIPDDMDAAALLRFSQAVKGAMERIYPPSAWFEAGAAKGDWLSFAIFAAVSVLIFGLAVFIIQRKFADICRRLAAHRTRGSFSMTAQRRLSPVRALYEKELRRYFASPVYVLNTIIGGVIMLGGAVAVSVMGVSKLDEMIPGGYIGKLLPFIMAYLSSMMPTTCSAISIEGKQWWIAKTLPVPTSAVFDAKILVQLTVALPFYIASCLILSLTFGLDRAGVLCLWITPLCYIILTAVLGITINAATPVFNWDSETAVVKQSASVGLTMLASVVIVAIPALAAVLLPRIDTSAICLIAGAIAVIIAAAMRKRNNALDLRSVGE